MSMIKRTVENFIAKNFFDEIIERFSYAFSFFFYRLVKVLLYFIYIYITSGRFSQKTVEQSIYLRRLIYKILKEHTIQLLQFNFYKPINNTHLIAVLLFNFHLNKSCNAHFSFLTLSYEMLCFSQ